MATGGRAFVPDIPGKEHVITSDEALELPALPKSIAIVGSGYIALEFACIFNALGTDVRPPCTTRRPHGIPTHSLSRGFSERASQGDARASRASERASVCVERICKWMRWVDAVGLNVVRMVSAVPCDSGRNFGIRTAQLIGPSVRFVLLCFLRCWIVLLREAYLDC